MQLYLVRHPQPRVAPGICYGRLDLPLAAPAAQAAARVRQQLPSARPADLPCWTSPAQRCRELATALHPAPQSDARLWEMHFGDWEGKSWEEIGASALDAWAADPAGFVPPGGESGYQLQARALAFVQELQQRGIGTALLVAHAGILRALSAYQQQLPGARWLELRFDYEQVLPLRLDLPT